MEFQTCVMESEDVVDLMEIMEINSVRISNLGWNFFPSKVVLGNPHLSCLWTDLSNILVDF